MMTTRRSRWALLALVVGAFYLFMAGENLLTTDPRRPGVALALAAFAALVPTALTVHRHRPPLGTGLIAVAMLTALAAWWTVVTPVALVGGALADGRRRPAMASSG